VRFHDDTKGGAAPHLPRLGDDPAAPTSSGLHPPLPSTTSSFLGARDRLEVRAHRPYRDDLGCSLGMTLFYVAVYVRGGNGDPGGNDGGGGRGGGGSAAAWRWRGGGCSVGGATKARRWRTAQRRQRGGSSAEAAADSPAPSANGPTHAPSNATDSPTYASLSLVEDGGTTASIVC
jgi:hypothetical protein